MMTKTSSQSPEAIIVDEARLLRLGAPGIFLLHVTGRPRLLIGQEHPHRFVDVDHEDDQQPDFDDRNERVAEQHVGVLIEDRRPQEHEDVAGDVKNEIDEQSAAPSRR